MPSLTQSVWWIFIVCLAVGIAWPIQHPPENIWRMMARALGKDDICLDAGASENPLGTSLVGIPAPIDQLPPFMAVAFRRWANPRAVAPGATDSPRVIWEREVSRFPKGRLGEPPLEFQLLGAAKAPLCFQFAPNYDIPFKLDVTYLPLPKPQFRAESWCQTIVPIAAPATLDAFPRRLPMNLFLICGDRAWAGIPSQLIGGPCALGKLTLFAPNMSKVEDWQSENQTGHIIRSKRHVEQFGQDCDSKIEHWPKSKRIAMSALLPWVAAAKALGELGELECWAAKQANLTSATLTELLQDERITRQAVLQNRAALDFLLLKHHHSCREFQGLCCFDLKTRAPDIQAKIHQIQQNVADLKQESSDWLYHLMPNSNVSGWAMSLLKDLGLVVFVIIVVLVSSLALWTLLKQLIKRLTSTPAANAALAPLPLTAPEDTMYVEIAPQIPPSGEGDSEEPEDGDQVSGSYESIETSPEGTEI